MHAHWRRRRGAGRCVQERGANVQYLVSPSERWAWFCCHYTGRDRSRRSSILWRNSVRPERTSSERDPRKSCGGCHSTFAENLDRLNDLPEILVQGRERAYLACISRRRARAVMRSNPQRSMNMRVSIPRRELYAPALPGTAPTSTRRDLLRPRRAPPSGSRCQCWRSEEQTASATRCARRSLRSASMWRAARSAKAADIFYRRTYRSHPRLLRRGALRNTHSQIVDRYVAASAKRAAWSGLASMLNLPLPKAAICSKPPVIIRFFKK